MLRTNDQTLGVACNLVIIQIPKPFNNKKQIKAKQEITTNLLNSSSQELFHGSVRSVPSSSYLSTARDSQGEGWTESIPLAPSRGKFQTSPAPPAKTRQHAARGNLKRTDR